MKIIDACKILVLVAPFTAKEAKIAYRIRARRAHPDKGGSDEAMKLVNEAYRLCSKGIKLPVAPPIDVHGVKFEKRKPTLKSVVNWFSNQMLGRVGDGFSWRKRDAAHLYNRLLNKCEELRKEINNRNKKEIIKECADVDNFAMMIAENARRKL